MATIADTSKGLEAEERDRKPPGLLSALAAVAVIITIVAVLSALIFGLMYLIDYGPLRAPTADENNSPVVTAPPSAPASSPTPR